MFGQGVHCILSVSSTLLSIHAPQHKHTTMGAIYLHFVHYNNLPFPLSLPSQTYHNSCNNMHMNTTKHPYLSTPIVIHSTNSSAVRLWRAKELEILREGLYYNCYATYIYKSRRIHIRRLSFLLLLFSSCFAFFLPFSLFATFLRFLLPLLKFLYQVLGYIKYSTSRLIAKETSLGLSVII